MVLGREVESRAACPSAAPRRWRSRRRRPARSSCGRLGTAISIAAQLGLDRVAARGRGAPARRRWPATSAITADASSPLALSWPICLDRLLRRACSSSVRVCSGLRSASSALKRSRVQERLRRLARFQSGDDAGEVAAQLGDVEHGLQWLVVVECRRRPVDRHRSIALPAPWASGKCTVSCHAVELAHRYRAECAQARDHLLHQDVGRRGAGRQADARACRRTTRAAGRRRVVDHVGVGAQPLRPARAGGCCCELVGLPTTITTSTCGASSLTASCRFCVA